MTLTELRDLARAVGFPDPVLAAAVAMAESTGNPYATNISSRETSFGLWQINTLAHTKFDASRLLDPNYNAHAALAVSQSGADWSPWTTFRTGAYKAFMGDVA